MNVEIWKTIPDFPKYKISNYGNIKNIKKILKQTTISGGYSSIKLNNENIKNKQKLVHVLVAQAFIDNPENKLTVNHKDHNKLNNNVNNLEWFTHKEQNFHRRKPTNVLIGTRSVWRIDKKTNEKLEKYNSIQLAVKWLFKNNPDTLPKKGSAHISDVCNNKKGRPSAYGYKWSYADTDEYDDEEWKDIPPEYIHNTKDCNVSNYGRLKYPSGQITGGYKNNEYLKVSIQKKVYNLHRLIAQTFLPNIENKPVVNHIDGNKLNSKLNNLEWVTHKENAEHAHATGLCIDNKNKIVQLDLTGNIINHFNSQVEASKQLNIDISCIRNCCNENIYKKTAGGFIFKYYNEDGIYDITNNICIPSNINGQKGVIQYDKNMNKIKEFTSLIQTSNELKLPYTTLCKYCKKEKIYRNFIFKYKTQ